MFFNLHTARKRWALAGFIGALGLAGLGLWKKAGGPAAGQLTEPLQKGTLIESVYGIGTVTATKSFQLKPGVTDTIRRLFVKEGDAVKRGEPLVHFDGGARMTAPFDGTVTRLPVKTGETVFSQSVILDLVDLLDRYLIVSLEQRSALKVRRGQNARLSFDGFREQSFEGSVESVYSSGDNFLVRIDAPRLPPQILPGMTADVAIGIAEHPGALLAPVSAIQAGRAIRKRGEGRADAVPVQTGVVDGAMAQILSGDLREGDRLWIPRKKGKTP